MTALRHRDPGASRHRRIGRRIATASLATHALALAVVLVATVPIVDPDWLFSADEGVALAQAELLVEGQGWIVDAPLPDLAPRVAHFELVERADGGYAPYAKHVLYPIVLWAPFAALGTLGAVLVSVLGTVLAAAGAGVLARELCGGWARSALWVTGAGSPLLFDAHLVIAHTPAAAAVVWGFVALERALGDRPHRHLWSAAAFAGFAVAALLRNEAVLLAVAAGVVVVIDAVRRRRFADVVVAALPGVAGVVAFVADPRLTEAVVGSPPGTIGAVGGGGPSGTDTGFDWAAFVGDRVTAFVVTVLLPGYGNFDLASVAVVFVLIGFLGAAVVAVRRPDDGEGIQVFLGLAGVGAAVRVLFGPPDPIPGLFVAFPLLAAGAVVIVARWSSLRTGSRRISATVVVFAAAVLATQYASGGSGEWGGRYFAVAVPLAVPVVVATLARLGATVDAVVARRAVAAVAACTVALSALGIATLRSTHDAAAELVEEVAALQDATGARYVVSADGYLARAGWRRAIDDGWLTVGRGSDVGLAERLVADGRGPVLVVGRGSDKPAGPDAVALTPDWTAVLVEP